MIKMIVFNKRKEGVTMEEYRRYYETIHAPLAESFFPTVAKYRRNYVDHERSALTGRYPENYLEDTDFDSVTEVFFKDWEAFETFRDRSAAPEVRARILEDEHHFLDPTYIKRYIVVPDGDAPWE
ncbi:EthD domain-containing protein [Streptomyces chartreusis]|uniref:EthD domain-containing protein n=1 Tax=Streptomyces chartreusis TaxID=1969 RepID=UPI002F917786|nr:EthD domain-containing protein [Streptomyces chartreusis]WTA33434.1 EthD domain-containing protein [Streptomyces chartreusis]